MCKKAEDQQFEISLGLQYCSHKLHIVVQTNPIFNNVHKVLRNQSVCVGEGGRGAGMNDAQTTKY